MTYDFYTDGAASMRKDDLGNYIREAGGWAWALVDFDNNNIIKYNNGHKDKTTNQEMELMAIHQVFAYYVENFYDENRFDTINIYSDSAYCVNMLQDNGWVYSWRKNGWTRGKKHEPIENLELVQKIYSAIFGLNEGFRKVNFIKVKGHSTDPYNDFVDKLAVQAKTGQVRGQRRFTSIIEDSLN